jgi:hypothetical protein
LAAKAEKPNSPHADKLLSVLFPLTPLFSDVVLRSVSKKRGTNTVRLTIIISSPMLIGFVVRYPLYAVRIILQKKIGYTNDVIKYIDGFSFEQFMTDKSRFPLVLLPFLKSVNRQRI